MPPRQLPMIFALCLLLAGCETFPELDAAITDQGKDTPAPELVDSRLILRDAQAGAIGPATESGLTARAAQAQARGQSLRGPVLTDAERQELAEASARLRQEAARVAPDS